MKNKLIFNLLNGLCKGLTVGFGLFVLILNFFPVQLQAQSIKDLDILGIECLFPGQQGCSSGRSVYDNLVDFGLNLAPFLAIIVIMWGGYRFLFGGLGAEQSDGKRTVYAGVIGLIIVLSARIITNLVRGSIGEGGAFNTSPLIDFISSISNFLFLLVGFVATLVIMWGGYKWLFSGLPGEQQDGKETVKKGLIGLVIVLIAAPLSNIIKATIGGQDTLELSTVGIISAIKTIIIGFMIPISSVVAVFFFVLGAYYLITARGDADLIKKGQNAMINAAIGLVVVLLSTTIVQLIIFFVPTNLDSGVPNNPSPVQNQQPVNNVPFPT